MGKYTAEEIKKKTQIRKKKLNMQKKKGGKRRLPLAIKKKNNRKIWTEKTKTLTRIKQLCEII